MARHVGVSAQSVSNALHRPERLNPDTRVRILAAIEELGYRPNRSARALRGRASGLLAVTVERSRPGRAALLLDDFLHGLCEAADGAGYHLILCQADTSQAELRAYRELRATTSVDGFILTGTRTRDVRASVLQEWAVPFASFGRAWNAEPSYSWVDVDGRAGLAAATRHVLDGGHRRVGYLGWPGNSDVGRDRRAGWQETCTARGVRPGPEERCRDDFDAAVTAAGRLLALPEPPTAVVCASDTLALGVLRAAADRGIPVGPDLAVTGFDDSAPAGLSTPALTSVRQPLADVAKALVDSVRREIEDPGGTPCHTLLEPQLVVRESSGGGPTPTDVTPHPARRPS
ncbi:LacI family DNA-binding transcriptional regulator [Nocardioides gansuensis]|uniref:LacI family DNA-binding transcriptional regulator n=1 Tax=Nocardioides gansuensis TaxID=2138300 RepID=UPI001403AC27|nr:LacI family DNA-binding transcriptional regulator [Nocardioides gansuensis]